MSTHDDTDRSAEQAVAEQAVPGQAVAEEAAIDQAASTVALAAERDEYLDALRRLQAEFDNYRKRTARQQTELAERVAQSLLEAMLPVLDALDLALAHVSEETPVADLAAALGQIGTLLRDTLAKEGLERIDAAGVEFDPTVHDAVAHLPSDEPAGAPALVEDVLRAGYRLNGRVVRPAMVRVRD